jgi:hypothetical protein
MIIKYNVDIDQNAIIKNIDRITNQIFKLLPSREEGLDWYSPLENLIIEITGMNNLLTDQTELFSLLCKMEGLLTLTEEDDFPLFRKTIFECLGLCSNLKKCLAD